MLDDPKIAPWQINQYAFPHDGAKQDQLRFLLGYAILAPSSRNTQPWKFDVGENTIDVFVDHDRCLPAADSDKRELHISVGCAIENLLIAAEHFGLGHDLTYLPASGLPDHVGRICFDENQSASNHRPATMFPMIRVRHTNHKQYDGRDIPAGELARLDELCIEHGIFLHIFTDREIKQTVDEIAVRGDAIQFSDPAFRQELAYWIGQGVFGTSWLMSKLEKLAVIHTNVGKSHGHTDAAVLTSSPAIAILSSLEDDPTSRIKVGQVFERVCLMAASMGIWTQPISQIVQVPELRGEVAQLIPVADAVPQHPFRLGYAEAEKEHTPRRPLPEVLVSTSAG